MKKLLLILPVLFICFGCASGPPIAPDSSDYEREAATFQAKEQHAIKAEMILARNIEKNLENLSDIVDELKELVQAPEVAPILAQARNGVDKALGSVDLLKGLIDTFQDIKGEPGYDVSVDELNIEHLEKDLKEGAKDERQARKALLGELRKARDQALGRKDEPLGGIFGIVKFVVLALMVIGSIVGVIYVRMTYGKIFGGVAGAAAVIVVGGFIFTMYREIVVMGALLLFGLAAVVAVIYLLTHVFKDKDFVRLIDEAKRVLPEDAKKEIERLEDEKLSPRTKNYKERIEKINNL